MPSSRKKFPGAAETTFNLDSQLYIIWTSSPRDASEEASLLITMREERAAYRARKRKRVADEDSVGDLGRFVEMARWEEADNTRVKEIERLKADNWRKERDLAYARDRIADLEDEVKGLGGRIRALETRALAARELLDV